MPHELHNKRQKYGWSAFLVPKTLTGCYYLCNTKLYIMFRSDWCTMKRWYKQRKNTWLLSCFLLNKENFTIKMTLCCKLGYLNQQEHHHIILDTASWQIICVWTSAVSFLNGKSPPVTKSAFGVAKKSLYSDLLWGTAAVIINNIIFTEK